MNTNIMTIVVDLVSDDTLLKWIHLTTSFLGFLFALWAFLDAVKDNSAYTGADLGTRRSGVQAIRNEALHIAQQALSLLVAVVTMRADGIMWLPQRGVTARVAFILMAIIMLVGAAANRKDRIRQFEYAQERQRRRGEGGESR